MRGVDRFAFYQRGFNDDLYRGRRPDHGGAHRRIRGGRGHLADLHAAQGRQEAATRLATGLVAGLVFGPATGLYGAERLDLLATLSAPEIVLSGSAAVSLTAWWALGALKRMAERWGR